MTRTKNQVQVIRITIDYLHSYPSEIVKSAPYKKHSLYSNNICSKPNEYHRLQIICIPPQPIINHCFRFHTLISIQPIENSSTSTSSRVLLYLVTGTRVHQNDHRQQQYNSGRSSMRAPADISITSPTTTTTAATTPVPEKLRTLRPDAVHFCSGSTRNYAEVCFTGKDVLRAESRISHPLNPAPG